MRIRQTIKLTLAGLIASLSVNASQSLVDMKVTTDGIYRVESSELVTDLGLSSLIGVDLTRIGVSKNGQLIPATIYSDNNSTFDASSYIEFVGKATSSIYQEGSMYSLVLLDTVNTVTIQESTVQPQANLATEPYYLHTDLYADNNAYSYGSPVNDPWFNKLFHTGVPSPNSFDELLDFHINNLVPQQNIKLEMSIWGGIDYLQTPDHHVVYEVNGLVVGDVRFDGVTASITEYSIPSNSISNGTQKIKISAPVDTGAPLDVFFLESWKVTYPRDFVLTDKKLSFSIGENQAIAGDFIFSNSFELSLKNYKVKNATNEKYLVYKVGLDGSVESYKYIAANNCTSSIENSCTLEFSINNSAGNVYISAVSSMAKPVLSLPVIAQDLNPAGANYLIISHPDFMIGDNLNELVTLREQDYNVKVVDVEQIYLQYGYGNVSAQSIADYIKYAKSQGVTDVLLVGGDTYDYKHYLTGTSSVSFIPTLYGQTDDLITFAPLDAKYADTDNDNIPDLNIGRLPVRTIDELGVLKDKIIAYTNKTYQQTAVFAADKFDISNGYSFKNDAEELISILPQSWLANITSANKIYLDNYEIGNTGEFDVVAATDKLNKNINQGVALTSFIGHSGPSQLSREGLYKSTDASALLNSDKPTLVTQWGCWNTYFVEPQENTLAHAFMLNQNGGAASVLGASTLTKAAHEKTLAKLVLRNLTVNGMTLGNAVTKAKQEYIATNPDALSDSLDVILGWNILGDPALKL